jgi:hypothetical protein
MLPSENLAMAQKITDIARPTTKSIPLEISIGILVKGKQKSGDRTITKNNDQKEILSNILEFINFLQKIATITYKLTH